MISIMHVPYQLLWRDGGKGCQIFEMIPFEKELKRPVIPDCGHWRERLEDLEHEVDPRIERWRDKGIEVLFRESVGRREGREAKFQQGFKGKPRIIPALDLHDDDHNIVPVDIREPVVEELFFIPYRSFRIDIRDKDIIILHLCQTF